VDEFPVDVFPVDVFPTNIVTTIAVVLAEHFLCKTKLLSFIEKRCPDMVRTVMWFLNYLKLVI
jgi:hypothetical protein